MTDQPMPHPPAATSGPAAPRPGSGPSRALLWTVVGIVGAVVVVVAVASAVLFAVGQGPSARETAEQYLAHIGAGEASAAMAMEAPRPEEVAKLADPLLLTDEVLGAAVERISDIEIVETGMSGGSYASFDVSYTLDDERYDTTLTLDHEDGAWPGPGRWLVTAPVTDVLPLTAWAPRYRVSGVELPTVAGENILGLALYPAVYPIEAVESTFYKTDRETLVASTKIGGDDPVELGPNEHLEQEVDRKIEALLDACATQTSWRPEGCPFSAGSAARNVPVAWSIEKYPDAQIEFDIDFVIAEGGEATASYTPEGASEPVVERVAFDVRAPYTIDGDVLSVRYE